MSEKGQLNMLGNNNVFQDLTQVFLKKSHEEFEENIQNKMNMTQQNITFQNNDMNRPFKSLQKQQIFSKTKKRKFDQIKAYSQNEGFEIKCNSQQSIISKSKNESNNFMKPYKLRKVDAFQDELDQLCSKNIDQKQNDIIDEGDQNKNKGIKFQFDFKSKPRNIKDVQNDLNFQKIAQDKKNFESSCAGFNFQFKSPLNQSSLENNFSINFKKPEQNEIKQLQKISQVLISKSKSENQLIKKQWNNQFKSQPQCKNFTLIDDDSKQLQKKLFLRQDSHHKIKVQKQLISKSLNYKFENISAISEIVNQSENFYSNFQENLNQIFNDSDFIFNIDNPELTNSNYEKSQKQQNINQNPQNLNFENISSIKYQEINHVDHSPQLLINMIQLNKEEKLSQTGNELNNKILKYSEQSSENILNKGFYMSEESFRMKGYDQESEFSQMVSNNLIENQSIASNMRNLNMN